MPPPLLLVALQAAGGSFLCWGRCLDTGVPRLEQPCSPEGRVKSTRRRKSAASGGRAGGARRLAAGPRDSAERSTKLDWPAGGAQRWKRGTLDWASPGRPTERPPAPVLRRQGSRAAGRGVSEVRAARPESEGEGGRSLTPPPFSPRSLRDRSWQPFPSALGFPAAARAVPEAGGATGAGGETSPCPAPVTCCAPLPPSLKWACFRWAGPASPNLPPGTWRTWTLCSASSSTGQCWAGGSAKRQPSVPGDEGEGRGDLSFGHLAANVSCGILLGAVLAAGGESGPALRPFQNRTLGIHPLWSLRGWPRAGRGYPPHCREHHLL